MYGRRRATYVQVKSSRKPAGKDCLVLDGSVWNERQLSGAAPIYNKHDGQDAFLATFIMVVDLSPGPDRSRFYIFPPEQVEQLLRRRAQLWAATPKQDGSARSIKFRKELAREELSNWEDAWHLLESELG